MKSGNDGKEVAKYPSSKKDSAFEQERVGSVAKPLVFFKKKKRTTIFSIEKSKRNGYPSLAKLQNVPA